MNFTLTDDQQMLKSVVERFVADRYDSAKRAEYRATPFGYSVENWALLAALGLFALPFSADDGGLGGGTVEIITVMEAIGRGHVVEPFLDNVLIAGALIARAGSAEQKAVWVPAIIAGEKRLALAHAEHGLRFALTAATTRYAASRLNGAKTFVAAGGDGWIVTAIGANGPGLYLVDAMASGVTWQDYRLVDGSVGTQLVFDDVLADPLPGAIALLDEVADHARMAASAEMIGIMSRMFDDTLAYVRQRRQFGASIGSFQVIQHRLADQYAALELARSQLYRGAMASAVERPAAIAAAKSFISRAAIALGEECIQMHGGMGVSDDLLLGHGHKRILMLASLFGDADYELRRYDLAIRGGSRRATDITIARDCASPCTCS